jgi:hypothetical protein
MKKLCGVVVFIGMLSALPATNGEYGKGQSGGQNGGQYGGTQPGTGGTTPYTPANMPTARASPTSGQALKAPQILMAKRRRSV